MNHLLQKQSMFVYSDCTERDVIQAVNLAYVVNNSVIFQSTYTSTYLIAHYLALSQNVPLEELLIKDGNYQMADGKI